MPRPVRQANLQLGLKEGSIEAWRQTTASRLQGCWFVTPVGQCGQGIRLKGSVAGLSACSADCDETSRLTQAKQQRRWSHFFLSVKEAACYEVLPSGLFSGWNATDRSRNWSVTTSSKGETVVIEINKLLIDPRHQLGIEVTLVLGA
jgi:hypothetical protein